MMGRKTLGEVRAELGAALGCVRGEVPESLRRFLGRESASAANAGPHQGPGATGTGQTTPTGPTPRRKGRRVGSPTGKRRRA